MLLSACGMALPAAAEGGMYPSTSKMLWFLFAFAFLIPTAITAIVCGVLKLIRPVGRPRIWVVYAAAWLTWSASLVALLGGFMDLFFTETEAFLMGGLLSLILAFFVALRSAKTNLPGPSQS